MFAIIQKELSHYFHSLTAYLIIGLFLLLSGLFTWVYASTSILDNGFADMQSFFLLCPYLFLFLIPALTMRSISEEFRLGTADVLLTKPISTHTFLYGKALAAWLLSAVALAPTLVYYTVVRYLGDPVGNIDTPSVIGSYGGLLLLAAFFVSIGIMASSFTQHQVLAFLIAVFISYFFYDGWGELVQAFQGENQTAFLSASYHFQSLRKGLIDVRDVLFFLSFSFLFMEVSASWVDKRLWV